jgi:hypothetical protein
LPDRVDCRRLGESDFAMVKDTASHDEPPQRNPFKKLA